MNTCEQPMIAEPPSLPWRAWVNGQYYGVVYAHDTTAADVKVRQLWGKAAWRQRPITEMKISLLIG